jgi:cell fate regulator YaaT (PSP1 superfamily)
MAPLNIVGIRFEKLGKTYHFNAANVEDMRLGDYAVVRTKRGRQIGQVVQVVDDPASLSGGGWKNVERKATPRDLIIRQDLHRKSLEATIACRAKASEIGIERVKIVSSELSFDGTTLTFLYSYEGEDKVNLSRLIREMRKEYPTANIEMRLVGPRDVAKILGGMGACGLETRCCSTFLTEFSPISIKMAKEQGLSLNPTEITGMCGRLRCCLIYEYEQYLAARKELPKRNKKVMTPMGEGKVISLLPLKQAVIVLIPEKGRMEFLKHEIEPWDELEALRRKAEAPCERHEGGGCDCGKDKKAKVE